MFPLCFSQARVKPIIANRLSEHATTLPYLAMSRPIVKEESFYEEWFVRHLFLMLHGGRSAATCRDLAETQALPLRPPQLGGSDVSNQEVQTSKVASPAELFASKHVLLDIFESRSEHRTTAILDCTWFRVKMGRNSPLNTLKYQIRAVLTIDMIPIFRLWL